MWMDNAMVPLKFEDNKKEFLKKTARKLHIEI
jgi:hypothetical protein